MTTKDIEKRTTVNIQEKANLIGAIADKLVGKCKLLKNCLPTCLKRLLMTKAILNEIFAI
jgi:hypothetical protein